MIFYNVVIDYGMQNYFNHINHNNQITGFTLWDI